jgi:tRNA(Ile)-lysidine synthase
VQVKQKLAVACSGGIDSLALAVIASNEFDVTALIVNHNLRKEAKTEAAKAAKILNRLGIKNKTLEYKGEVPQKNVQQEARKLRYKMLTDYCKKNKIPVLATAHHADDNAENFLLRLARGSGVDGLSSMQEEIEMHGIRIIRPLLQYTKKELTEFLEAKNIEWVEDATNKSDKYKRNSLRHALDKVEERELITKRINDASRNLARAKDFLEKETTKAEKDVVKYYGKSAEIDAKKFTALHEEITFRLLNKVISRVSPKPSRPRFSELQTLKAALLKNQKKTLSGLVFAHKKGKILITIEK